MFVVDVVDVVDVVGGEVTVAERTIRRSTDKGDCCGDVGFV